MSSQPQSVRILYENLDTSFVNLWALLRYLSRRGFVGRVRVELEDYSADVFVNGSETPLVHEVDRAAGTDVVEEAALHRLVLRVRESSGSITVYEGAHESIPPPAGASAPASAESSQVTEAEAATPESMRSSAEREPAREVVAASGPPAQRPSAADEWSDTVRVSGEIIGAVDRAATSLGADFAVLFREARISLADDYSFLDPMTGELRYEDSKFSTDGERQPEGYVRGVTEALTKVVAKLASGEKARRTRERIAIELARVARKNSESLARSGFGEQLDGIAGTKVI